NRSGEHFVFRYGESSVRLRNCVPIQGADETVPSPRHSFHITRIFSRLAQGIPKPLYSGVNAVIKLDDGVIRPQSLPYLLPQDYSPRLNQQHSQNLERLFLKTDPRAVFGQFAGPNVEFKRPKSDGAAR